MSQEDIIKLAQEAGLIRAGEHYTEPARWGISVITHFAKLVAAAEREACAALLDAAVENFTSISLQVNDEDGIVMEHANTCSYLAEAIRARSGT